MPKVANPRDKRELHRDEGADNIDHDEWFLYQPHTQSGSVGLGATTRTLPMFSGLMNRETEMSAMVSALTHVVSGDVPFGLVDESHFTSTLASASDSASGSSYIGVGQKRGRDEDGGKDLREPFTRLSRAFGDFKLEGSSNSGLTGTINQNNLFLVLNFLINSLLFANDFMCKILSSNRNFSFHVHYFTLLNIYLQPSKTIYH